MSPYRSLAVAGVLASAVASFADEPAKSVTPKSRTFEFTYAATVTGLPEGKTARVWLPVPPSNDEQHVALVGKELPAKERIGRESQYGNRILYFEAAAGADGKVPLRLTYRVLRREVRGDLSEPPRADEPVARYLEPDALVPVGGRPLDLIKKKEVPKDQFAAARMLYDVVNAHMRYRKTGTGWGRGDAVWACDNGYGNCSDFHSLFISLARSLKIPAKFEIGFPIPEKHGAGDIPGYHCWAKFRPEGKGWVPVDISEANKNPSMKDYYFGNLTADRVAFSTGRDLELVPRQDGPPVNFLIYPYVEVEGKPYPADKVQKHFAYRDVPAGK